jgi:hypothetical protein
MGGYKMKEHELREIEEIIKNNRHYYLGTISLSRSFAPDEFVGVKTVQKRKVFLINVPNTSTSQKVT